MRNFDFSSWSALLSTVLGLAVITLIGVGIRLIVMQTIQMRRERENRQINERLRTLMAAYKTLGGSFTGTLTVDPTHLRDLRRASAPAMGMAPDDGPEDDAALAGFGQAPDPASTSDRPRRIRDAVEAALSDILLLGTEEQVRLAARAATDLAEGRPIHTAELVVSLRDSIRSMLRLGPVPSGIAIPAQGPTRPSGSRGGGRDGAKAGGGKGGGGGAGGVGGGLGVGVGMGLRHSAHDDPPSV